jgi:hypothetical protein
MTRGMCLYAGLGFTLSGEDEEVLKQFDFNSAFGPCVGVSRKERYALQRLRHVDTNVQGFFMPLTCL